MGKSQLAVTREINRLSRRIDHLRGRIQIKKKAGLCYSYEYDEMCNCQGRKEALVWAKGS